MVGARRPRRRLCARSGPRRTRPDGLALHRRQGADRRRRAAPASRASPTSCPASTATCRRASAGAGFMFWVFHVNRDYVRQLREARRRRALADWLAINDELEAAQIAAADRLRPPRSAARQPHRRRQAALADRLRICRLRHRHVRSRQPQLEQQLHRRSVGSAARRLFRPRAGRSRRCAATPRWSAPRCCARRCGRWSASAISIGPGVDYAAYAAREFRQARCGARRLPRPLRKAQLMTASGARPSGGDRRRHHRLLDRLSSGQGAQGERRSARAGQAHLRLDLARRGPRRPAPLVGLDHPGAEALGRALQDARSRNRPRHRLEDDRLPAPRHHPRPLDRVQAPRHHRPQLRHGHGADLAGRGQGDVAADERRRPHRRLVAAHRRPGLALRHHPVAGPRRPHARRDHSSKACASPASRWTGAGSRPCSPPTAAIACETVINCGGQWAREIGAMAGINVPLQPVKHQYIVTEKIEGLQPRRRRPSAIPTAAPTSRKKSAAW